MIFKVTEYRAAEIVKYTSDIIKNNNPVIKLSCFEIELAESVDCIKKYQFVESGINKWKNGFTEIRKLGTRYTIRHDMSKTYHVTNVEDMEVYVRNFLRMNGYGK